MDTLSDMETNSTIDETETEQAVAADAEVLAEVLVEEISIDGMCGVY